MVLSSCRLQLLEPDSIRHRHRSRVPPLAPAAVLAAPRHREEGPRRRLAAGGDDGHDRQAAPWTKQSTLMKEKLSSLTLVQ